MSFPKKKPPSGMTGGKPRPVYAGYNQTQEPWIKAIPFRNDKKGHGNGVLQKRLWRLVSDYVRIRDWYKYGTCVATGKRIEHWKIGNAGHFLNYAVCNAMFKFDERNIYLQTSSSNKWGGQKDIDSFEEELFRRTGMDKAAMKELNREYVYTTINDSKVIDKMIELLHKMKELPEQPEYYERAFSLLSAKTVPSEIQ